MDGIALRLAKRLFDQRLIQNQFRSAYVKEMVEPYLSVEGWRHVDSGPSGWDFERGEDRLMVKQSAALQVWPEMRSVRARGIFDISTREDGFEFGGIAKPLRSDICICVASGLWRRGRPSQFKPMGVLRRIQIGIAA